MFPDVGVINPSNIPMVVVFPHPFGPRSAKVSLWLIEKLIPFTASVVLNCFFKFLTSIDFMMMLFLTCHLLLFQYLDLEFL